MKTLPVLLMLLTCSPALAQGPLLAPGGGNGGVGGGDGACEARFHDMRRELLRWIDEAKFEDLELPAGVTLQKYTSGMKRFLADGAVVVACYHETPEDPHPIRMGTVPKICLNAQAAPGEKARVNCDFEQVLAAKGDVLFRTLHHEFANLAGIEPYGDEISDYTVSNQVALYAGEVRVWRLGIRKRADTSSPCLNLEEVFNGKGPRPFLTSQFRVLPDGTTVSGAFLYSVLHNTTLSDGKKMEGMEFRDITQRGCEQVDFKGWLGAPKIVTYSPTYVELENGMKFDLVSPARLALTYRMGYTTPVGCPSAEDPSRAIQESHTAELQTTLSLDGSELGDVPTSREFIQAVARVASNGARPTREERLAVCRERGAPIPDGVDFK
jgi:hypothetical protein